jgi:hypothetical protein
LGQAQQVYILLRQGQEARLAHHEVTELRIVLLELVDAIRRIEQAIALQVKPTQAFARELGYALMAQLRAQRGLSEAGSYKGG